MQNTITQPSTATCSCGFTFELNGKAEDDHFVWAVRADGSRSNLGECPTTWGGWQGAMRRLASNGHTWFGMGVLYRGKNYGWRFVDNSRKVGA